MAHKFRYTPEKAQNDWADTIKEVIRDQSILDKMGSADLKRIGKALTLTIIRVGERAAKAENALEQKGYVTNDGLKEAFDSVTARNIELTGGRPPEWSYLYRDNVDVMHHFVEFVVKKNAKQATVFGILEGGDIRPLYDFDYKGLGVTQATGAARLMAVHLRICFVPRELLEFEEI